MKKRLSLFALPVLALSSVAALAGCGKAADHTLVVYNWEDYIYEGTDDRGNIVGKSTIELFKEYFEEKHNETIDVKYETFSTCEEMYKQIKLGAISPDLICPSDYMIQKMANEGLLEEFSYNGSSDKYGESLKNVEDFCSPYIHKRFKSETLENGKSFLSYAVPYFWGTMGFTYDPAYFSEEDVSSWECLWSKEAKFQKQFTLKNSVRDTYVAAIFHVFKAEIAALNPEDLDYNAKLSAYFNKCDDDTIMKVETALKEAKKTTVYALEVDEGKDEIVKGTYHANLAWSGDSVYSMDNAEGGEDEKILNYSLPSEGSNVWFDGWCMPKGAQKELAEEFVNFMSDSAIASKNMGAVGYTSPFVGEDVWELVNDWYAADDEEEDVYTVDLSFYFGDSIEGEAVIDIPTENKGRQFDAQYPTEEVLKRCCIMKDFGDNQTAVDNMWGRVAAA